MDELKQTKDTADLPAEVAVPRYGQQMDQQTDAELRNLSRFFLKHPSLVLTCCYLIASVMGLIFTLSLLDEFEFHVLPYLELTDFLLAAIAHPKTILNLIIGIVSVVFTVWFERKCRKKYLKYALWIDKSYRSTSFLPNWIWGAFTFVFYLYFASTVQVPKIAQAIKNHQTEHYQLSLIYPIEPGGKEIRQLNEVQMITRTVSYLWIYHQGQVKLIPHANVAALIPVLLKKSNEKPDLKITEKAVDKADNAATTDKAKH